MAQSSIFLKKISVDREIEYLIKDGTFTVELKVDAHPVLLTKIDDGLNFEIEVSYIMINTDNNNTLVKCKAEFTVNYKDEKEIINEIYNKYQESRLFPKQLITEFVNKAIERMLVLLFPILEKMKLPYPIPLPTAIPPKEIDEDKKV